MKEKILDKAKELFCQFGYKTVTMDEVAAQLGISKRRYTRFMILKAN
ncbi:TetR/AcrR family transcriptional regulator [Ornithobacterium rhinotracheale]